MKNTDETIVKTASGKRRWRKYIIGGTVVVTGLSMAIMFHHMNVRVSDAAVNHLTGIVDMVGIAADGLLMEDAEALKLIAEKSVTKTDLNGWMNDFCGTNGMTGILLTKPGENVRLAGSGTDIPLEELDFSQGEEIDGLSLSPSYVNSDGNWAYALTCPIMDGDEYIADVIAEYEWKHIELSLPTGIYVDDTSLLLLDNLSGAVVIQSEEGRAADGEIADIEDFFQVSGLENDEEVQQNIVDTLEDKLAFVAELNKNGTEQVTYIWPVNEGTAYLIGTVPVKSIMSELPAVSHSFFFSGAVMLICCCIVGLTFAVFSFREKRDLEKLDKERAAYNKELQKALDKAKRANAAKTVFLSNMSHDMRTPLNGITGLLKIEEDHPGDMELIKEDRKKMKVSADYLLSLVNDVLQMSKLEDDNIVLAHEPMDFRNLAMDVVTLIGERAAEKGISLTYEQQNADEIFPYIYTSPLHIRQLLLNIYGNCIKYNREGGNVHTKIICLGKKDGRVTYRWIISDTGIGMSEEFLEHIFEPFSQEHTDARSVYSGVGLGMAIVKKIVDAMGGTIEVTSKVGEGSTFTLTISFDLAEEKDVAEKLKPYTAKKEYTIEGCHILMAEDNELNAEIARTLLTDRGASVTTVENGREALTEFEKNPAGTFDCILMDVMMPVMDGLSATRAIRVVSRKDARTIPIIAMTANAFEEDEKQCLEAGMTAYLAKPLEIEKVVETIARCCGGEV